MLTMGEKAVISANMAKVKPFLYQILIVCLIGLSQPLVAAVPSEPLSEMLPSPAPWSMHDDDDDVDGYLAFIQKLIAGIVAFVIVVVAVCLILCFCCPICIIAKMRQRRGVVIRTGPGATATTNGRNITITVPPPTSTVSSPPLVAIPNNYNAQNKPYPVQESVTVVPLLQPHQPQYPQHPQPVSYSGPQQYQHQQPSFGSFSQLIAELPPPYPGLPREADNANLPYNPYFTGEGEGPSAPPPK